MLRHVSSLWHVLSLRWQVTKRATMPAHFVTNEVVTNRAGIAPFFSHLDVILFHYSVHWIVWLIGSSLPSLLSSLIYFIVYLLAFCAIHLFICSFINRLCLCVCVFGGSVSYYFSSFTHPFVCSSLIDWLIPPSFTYSLSDRLNHRFIPFFIYSFVRRLSDRLNLKLF